MHLPRPLQCSDSQRIPEAPALCGQVMASVCISEGVSRDASIVKQVISTGLPLL
jgi:hypothetical protein